MRGLAVAWGAAAFLAAFAAPPALASPDGYTRYVIGDLKTPAPQKPQAALMLVGGGDWDYDAFRWFAAKAGHGHIVILRASGGADEGEEFYQKAGGIASAETFVFDDRKAATNPYILNALAHADGVFIAGGDQARYVRFWKGTPVAAALDKLARTGHPIGGTSAGLAILGGHGYGALDGGSITSKEALADPAGSAVTMFGGFLTLPHMQQIVTDTHFAKRDRLGRLIAFVARVRADGQPHAVGLGVDQEAALCVDGNGVGRLMTPPGGYAWLVEPKGRAQTLKPGAPLTHRDVRVTGVGPDGSIDLKTLKVANPSFSGVASVIDGKLADVPGPPNRS